MKKQRIIYWISTGLLCVLFLIGGLMYIFNYPRAEGFFISLGFPVWIIYPLAVLKFLGVVAILTKRSAFLKELAYAGFMFDATLALSAHLVVEDGEYLPAILSLVLIGVSWRYDRIVFGRYESPKERPVPGSWEKRIYWATTGFICLMFAFGGIMYFVNYDMAYSFFVSLGFPVWIIYPLAILKILGPVAILTRKSGMLKELAYAGFLFDAILAVTAHIMVEDGFIYHGMLAILSTIISWIYDRKIFGAYVQKRAPLLEEEP